MSSIIALVLLLLITFGLGIAMLGCWYQYGIRRSTLVVACFLPLMVAIGQAIILASGMLLSKDQHWVPLHYAGLVSVGTLLIWSLRSVPNDMGPVEGALRVLGILLLVGVAQLVLIAAVLILGFYVGRP